MRCLKATSSPASSLDDVSVKRKLHNDLRGLYRAAQREFPPPASGDALSGLPRLTPGLTSDGWLAPRIGPVGQCANDGAPTKDKRSRRIARAASRTSKPTVADYGGFVCRETS